MLGLGVILVLLGSLLAKQVHLNYNHHAKTLILFQENGDTVELKLAFDSKDFSVHQSLKDKPLYLNKGGKFKLDPQSVKYDYKVKMGLKEKEKDGILGSIGVGEGGQLYTILKKILKVGEVKVEVRHREGMLNVVGQGCHYPVFLPIMVTLSQINTHSYPINKFSTNFSPDSSFLSVVDRAKSPFQMSKAELAQEVTVSTRDRVISIPLSDLLQCGKYANSDSFECELPLQAEADIGGLLFDFDPTLCGGSVEFEGGEDSVSVWGYHYSHVLLMLLQFGMLGCLVRAERVRRLWKGALGVKQK